MFGMFVGDELTHHLMPPDDISPLVPHARPPSFPAQYISYETSEAVWLNPHTYHVPIRHVVATLVPCVCPTITYIIPGNALHVPVRVQTLVLHLLPLLTCAFPSPVAGLASSRGV